jgi:hypothetical protein
MKIRILLLLSVCVLLGACKRRKVEAPPVPETPAPAAPEQKLPAPVATTPPAAGAAPGPPTVAQFESGVEFADLNNVIAGFEFRNKRLPTMDELQRAYYGGKRPIQVPSGHTLVIDPQSKKVKAVPSR